MITLLDEAIQKVRALPTDQQNMIADVIMDYVDDSPAVQLSASQIEDIRGRLADPSPRFASIDDVMARLSPRHA